MNVKTACHTHLCFIRVYTAVAGDVQIVHMARLCCEKITGLTVLVYVEHD